MSAIVKAIRLIFCTPKDQDGAMPTSTLRIQMPPVRKCVPMHDMAILQSRTISVEAKKCFEERLSEA